MAEIKTLSGAGLGLRRELIPELLEGIPDAISFVELAPENWLDVGGRLGEQLAEISARIPVACHGLSLSLGGPGALDEQLLRRIRQFMHEHGIGLYTEHLSWCADDNQLYDLLPIPQTMQAVRWVADRIARAQDIMGMRIGVENASAYLVPPGAEMSEAEFVSEVVLRADCGLHLDINNVFVNACNFGFDALSYLKSLPLDRVCYMHVAGHHTEPDGIIIDTHGADVIDPVWQLLDFAHSLLGKSVPTCLERDFNIPDLSQLCSEVERIVISQSLVASSQRTCTC